MEDIEIRLSGPDDAPAVREFLGELSPESRWLRYHSAVPTVRTWMVDAVACADHERCEALVAWMGDRIVGVAEWGRREPGAHTADVAVVVDEAHRRRGIARALLLRLASDAAAHGLDEFTASVLSTNRPTMALIQGLVPQRTAHFNGQTIEYVLPLHARYAS